MKNLFWILFYPRQTNRNMFGRFFLRWFNFGFHYFQNLISCTFPNTITTKSIVFIKQGKKECIVSFDSVKIIFMDSVKLKTTTFFTGKVLVFFFSIFGVSIAPCFVLWHSCPRISETIHSLINPGVNRSCSNPFSFLYRFKAPTNRRRGFSCSLTKSSNSFCVIGLYVSGPSRIWTYNQRIMSPLR